MKKIHTENDANKVKINIGQITNPNFYRPKVIYYSHLKRIKWANIL